MTQESIIITLLYSAVLSTTTAAGLRGGVSRKKLIIKDVILAIIFGLFAPQYMGSPKGFAVQLLVGVAFYFVTLNYFTRNDKIDAQ